MLKGFAITPIINGRIAIGEIVEQGGRRLPNKLDHIIITKNHQSNGHWAAHPEMDRLIEEQKAANNPHGDKLRSIPVRIMFDRPENNFTAEYTCFDEDSRTVCSGNGETARRRDDAGVQEVSCPGADICSFGKQNRCKQFARLIVGMESSFEEDPLSGFMFRTTSFNTIRSITFRLKSLAAVTGGKMAGMPCNLVMKAKSTSASYRKPIFYLDLVPSGGLVKATQSAVAYREAFAAAGLNRDDLEKAVAEGISQSAFYEGGDDGEAVVEEFYQTTGADEGGSDTGGGTGEAGSGIAASTGIQNNLASKEQIIEIERLMELSGKDQAKLLEWLGKPIETGLFDLTPEEAERSIQVLTPKQAETPEQVTAAVVENTDKKTEETPAKKPVVEPPVAATPAEVTPAAKRQTKPPVVKPFQKPAVPKVAGPVASAAAELAADSYF